MFEQLLSNSLAQVAHTADLFSLNPAVQRTYFVRQFTDSVLAGYSELVDGLDQAALEDMTETRAEFLARRNRFLDHLLARFGEQFREYTLLLTSLQGQEVGQARLIDDKLAFLKAYPLISHDRGKAFSYKQAPCAPANIAGLKRRIHLLLGYPDLAFSGTLTGTAPGSFTLTDFQLQDQHNKRWLAGTINHSGPSEEAATQEAFREILKQMIQPTAYAIVPETEQFRLTLQDKSGNPLGQHPHLLPTKAAAEALREELLTWSSHARAMVVEHLLLRPKFPGDALYPACSDGACTTCGEEDPYSFRLTLVLPGWTAPFSTNLELRGFANRTIQQETPAHLLEKTCWVGNDGFLEDPCDAVVMELANVFTSKGLTAEGTRPSEAEACACALRLYAAFSAVFRRWYADKTLTYWQRDALAAQLKAEFSATLSPSDFACTTILTDALWDEVQAVLGGYFAQTALTGWQFERFEDAWCAWLTANAAFDWTEERLQERAEAILRAGVASYPTSAGSPAAALCACAATIVAQYGGLFRIGWKPT